MFGFGPLKKLQKKPLQTGAQTVQSIPISYNYLRTPMADLSNRYPENTNGTFYVDDQCIDCDLCRETAPANFTRNDDGGYSFVYKQPESDDERELCQQAMEGCPVEAIGSDGEG